MEQKIVILFRLKIKRVFNDGFEGIDTESKKRFDQKTCFVKDKICLKENIYKIGQIVNIKIEVISKEDIKEEIPGKKFYCVINELTNEGFYTKSFDENESRFMRRQWFNSRGMITFPNEEIGNSFEIGDILKITIRRWLDETSIS